MERLLTIIEASEVLLLAPKTLYQYTSSRKIPHVKYGNAIRFRESDLELWIESHKVDPLKEGRP